MESIDVTGIKLRDIHGSYLKVLNGVLTKDELAKLMIENWLPEYCLVCDRNDYCKYGTIKNPSETLSKRCGICSSIITNYVDSSFPYLLNKNKDEIQKFFDGSYFFTYYIFETEKFTGMMMEKHKEEVSMHTPALFGFIAQLRDPLDQMAFYLQSFPEFHIRRGFLLVEGDSEFAFVKILEDSGQPWFHRILVESYEGKPNRAPTKLRLLAKRYQKDGYILYIQGDKDSKDNDVFQQLIKSDIVKSKNTFSFKHEFESSIPDDILFDSIKILSDINLPEQLTLNKFKTSIADKNQSVIISLKNNLGIDISDKKVSLAKEVGKIINSKKWWEDADFQKSELYEFMKFLTRCNSTFQDNSGKI